MTVDHRFFSPKGALALSAVAEMTGAILNGDGSTEVTGLAASADACSGEICFFEGKPAEADLVSSEAAACFVDADSAHLLKVPTLIVERPRYAHALVGDALFDYPAWGSSKAPISPGANVSSDCVVSPCVSIAEGAAIGSGTHIGPNSSIGPGVQIGKDCRIGANVSIQCTLVGDRVKILSGARIGEAGFGVMVGPKGPVDAPQYGRVIVQDGVTIGANSTIDRGAFNDTVIGEHSKIDNLCQIAHNVVGNLT